MDLTSVRKFKIKFSIEEIGTPVDMVGMASMCLGMISISQHIPVELLMVRKKIFRVPFPGQRIYNLITKCAFFAIIV